MTDLIEKLRMIHEWKIGNEAADRIEAQAARIAELEAALAAERSRMMAWCSKRQKITRLNWERAARKALAGDVLELRNRIDMIDAGPLDVVLSENRENSHD